MLGKWVWAEGQLRVVPGLSRKFHRDILNDMMADGTITKKPRNIAGGDFSTDDFHGPQFDRIRVIWERGNPPTEDELLRMIQIDLGRFGREAAVRKRVEHLAVTTEDTEPTGGEGFLKDPHKALYPYLFPDGGTEMPDKVRHLLKSHVLNQLEEAFEDPDNFIYFTVYGSGVSYNWDEGGDLDVQMWIDIEKFQALNEDQALWTMDDLLAEIRRNVQMVNFPTVKDIGLTAPDNSEEDVTGGMLIQYYPKPGKGSKEENLASKPYACLDLENGEWLIQPKPFDPSFYGLHFLEVMPKATDMAIQAEALLDEYERNVLNWQFWFSLYSRYRNPAYQEQYQEAQRNAIMEKAGIKTMFEGIFGGRADAYSPEGKGIEDERDMLQKILEVWGIFQRLKHYARATLPWDTTEMPDLPKSTSEDRSESDTDEEDGYAANDPEDFIFSHTWSLAKKSEWIKTARLMGIPESAVGTNPDIARIADEYMQQSGLPYDPPKEFSRVHKGRAGTIAQAYDAMEHNPNDPAVREAYDAMVRETMAQYNALKKNGYQFEFYPEGVDPYPGSPHKAVEDLAKNKHLYVYPTAAGFGDGSEEFMDHPLLSDSGERWNGQPVTYNDIFRAVHDVFGHGKEGVGFRANGEENAWRQHSAMYSDPARKALTSETRGQNSWVNFGPYGEQNRNADQMSTVYADQKAGILPDWAVYDGAHDHNWRVSKLSMAERSGDPTLDKLIEKFMQTTHGFLGDVADYRNPEIADGYCNLMSENLCNFLATHGIASEMPRQTPRQYGYGDRIAPGHSHHYAVKVNMPSGTYMIDFTASQYGYKEFPMVQRLNDGGSWDRQWTSASDLTIPLIPGRTYHVTAFSPTAFDVVYVGPSAEGRLQRFTGPDGQGDYNWMTERVKNWTITGEIEEVDDSQSWDRQWTSAQKFAAWADVMEKAQRIRDAGGVQLQMNGKQHIIGTVMSGTREGVQYNPEIWRQDPNSNTISLWDCTCEWSGFSWGRTRQWKKYEGRPCAHVLALYWTGLSSPLDDEGNAGDQLQIPGLDPYATQPPPTPVSYPQQPSPIDLNQALQQTVVPPVMPAAQMPQNQPIQQPTKPKKPDQMTITFPGAISKWRKNSALQNGDYARTNKPMLGFDDRGTQYTVPRNSIVEILYSDDLETIAIYSLGSGPLGPHNARIVGETNDFTWVPRTRGTAPKRHR